MKRLVLALAFAAAALPASAATFFNNSTGLTGTFTTVNLTTPVVAQNAAVTNQFAAQGISFQNAFFDPQSGIYPGPAIGNYQGNGSQQPNITFQYGPGVAAAAFRLITNQGTSLLQAYLGNALVASQSFSTSVDITQFYGVTGGGFDRIVITAPGNLALQATDFQIANGVPEPESWAMLIAGFGLVGAVARRRRTVVAA